MWVKLCGLRTDADLDAAIAAGADAVGFVLVDSPRRVDDASARRLSLRAAGRVRTVGVFRRLDPEALAHARSLGMDLAQGVLDGVGPGSDVLAVLGDGPDLGTRVAALGSGPLLIDGPRFGSGTAADWGRVAAVARERSVILAGGLHAGNVREAIECVRPMGVDVSSGIEASLGEKCPERMRAFVQAARAASHHAPSTAHEERP